MDKIYIFTIGEIDGRILEAYSKVQQKEQELGIYASWIISPGSFGIWPDSQYVDSATRKNGNVGDFHRLYYERWAAPRNTLFISGAHEDHYWLQRRWKSGDNQLLGNLWYLANGYKTTIGPSISGLGKVYSPKTYNSNIKSIKHYNKKEVERLCSAGPTDILLTHQAPKDELFGQKTSNSEGIKTLLYAIRPSMLIHSGYNVSKKYKSLEIPCFSLQKMEILILEYDYDTKKIRPYQEKCNGSY